jgi:hypothetical protein
MEQSGSGVETERIQEYSEGLLEKFVKDHPEVFLGERLTLVSQQPLLGGFRPDLIFRDIRETDW